MSDWSVTLNGVTLGCEDGIDVLGTLSFPPDGLGLPGLRTEDVTYPQRDGVRHFNDWYEPRIITLEEVVVCADDWCEDCGSVRQRVQQILKAWSRQCDDVELVIRPNCDSDDPEVAGPFGVIGRPRVATVNWARGVDCATLLLRFDAVDERMYLLDPSGEPGSGFTTVTVRPDVETLARCYPRCYTGGGGGGPETVLRTNLHPNPFLGSEGAGWTLEGRDGVTQTVETEGGPLIDGRTVPWRKLTFAEGSGDPVIYSNGDGSPWFPLTDDEVAVSVHVMGSGIEVELGLQTDTGEVWGTAFNPGEGWTQLDSVLTPPPGSTEGRLLIRLAGESITPSSSTGVTGAMVGATGTTFDGDSPDGGGIRYDWTGSPYASPSEEVQIDVSTQAASLTYCYDTSIGTGAGPVFAEVLGTETAYPCICFHPGLTDPVLENITTGSVIGIRGTVSGRAPLCVDTETRTAMQGGASRTHLITGDPSFLLVPGENELRLTSFATTDDGYVNVSYRSSVVSA